MKWGDKNTFGETDEEKAKIEIENMLKSKGKNKGLTDT
jgi:hypothetical protein